MGMAGVRAFARRCHRGQLESDGSLYVTHLDRVARTVAEAGGGQYQQMAALCHGVLKRTELGLGELALQGVPLRAVRMVEALTPRPDEYLEPYLRRLLACPGAGPVRRACIADVSARGGLTDTERRVNAEILAAVDAAGINRAEQTAELIRVLPASGEDSWWRAVSLLGRLRAADAVAPLISVLGRNKKQLARDFQREDHVLSALHRIMTGKGKEFQWMGGFRPGWAYTSSWRLRGYSPDARWVPVLTELAGHECALLREFSIALLSRLRDDVPTGILLHALADSSSEVSRFATDGLVRTRTADVFEPLLAMLCDPDAGWWKRRDAAWALGRLGDRRAVPHLLDALDCGTYAVEVAAGQALARIGDRSVIPALVRRLRSAEPGGATAARTLGDLRAHEAVDALAQKLDELLRIPWRSDYSGACYAEALGKIGQVSALPALAAAARAGAREPRSRNPGQTRYFAVWAIGSIAPQLAVDTLLAAAQDPLPEVREQALRALARTTDSRVVEPLGALLTGQFARIAAQGLARSADERAISALVELLTTTTDRRLRNLAGQALVRTGSAAVNEMCRMLGHPNGKVRRVAAWVLGRLPARDAAQSLIRALGDTDEYVRARAATALVMAGDEATDSLTRALRDPAPRVRARAAAALAQQNRSRQVVRALERARSDPSPAVRDAASAALRDPNARA
jgi:HEAT repeat protein